MIAIRSSVAHDAKLRLLVVVYFLLTALVAPVAATAAETIRTRASADQAPANRRAEPPGATAQSDEATVLFMQRFYARLATGDEPQLGLRTTQRSFAAEGKWRDPIHWAAFVLTGR